ncbi:hypothetical protein [Sedimentitalea todarodis]|uniref:Uncharacterized protein n=1 Tax=Sedimentitalea todarodis TaxID=1631240 RepID=A0ABU3VC67_9RHOB|nr:hypothetical protein [Sedimentitalea todarodis]MDU9003761.1 hypothetical protein [Sedimentitalea todarodis]
MERVDHGQRSAGLLLVRPSLAGTACGLSGALAVGIGAVLTSGTDAIVTAEHAPFAVLGIMSMISGTRFAVCALCPMA